MKLTTEAWSITERAYHNGQEKVFPYGNRGGNTELEWATLPITIQNLFNLESAMTLYVQKNSWLVLKSTFHWKTNRRKSNFLNCHSLKILIFFCLFFRLKVYFNTLKDHVMYLSVDISSSKWQFQKHLFREWWVIVSHRNRHQTLCRFFSSSNKLLAFSVLLLLSSCILLSKLSCWRKNNNQNKKDCQVKSTLNLLSHLHWKWVLGKLKIAFYSWNKFQICCRDIYLIRFLPNFAVFCVFLWISRDLPEFRGSATARKIRSLALRTKVQ